jgi:hypothetical protein
MTIYSLTEIAGMAERAAAQHGTSAENPFPVGHPAHDAFAASLERYLLEQACTAAA